MGVAQPPHSLALQELRVHQRSHAPSIHNKGENANGAGETESCLSAINPVWCPATICIFTAPVL